MFNYDKLRDAIDNSGLRKSDLCASCGRPKYWLNDVLRQKNKIPRYEQEILAKELGVTVEWLNDLPEKEIKDDDNDIRNEILALLFGANREKLIEARDFLKK